MFRSEIYFGRTDEENMFGTVIVLIIWNLFDIKLCSMKLWFFIQFKKNYYLNKSNEASDIFFISVRLKECFFHIFLVLPIDSCIWINWYFLWFNSYLCQKFIIIVEQCFYCCLGYYAYALTHAIELLTFQFYRTKYH